VEVLNANGNPQSLVPAPEGNTRGLKHGAYSRSGRALAPRAEEIADALLTLPHVHPLDTLAAEEIGSLLATLEAIDGALADGRVENKRGQARHLLDMKARLSRQLREWLREFGATRPRAPTGRQSSRARASTTSSPSGLQAIREEEARRNGPQ
jgi:hypothetical protein